MRDYYGTLQVDPHADQDVIEAAYRSLARKWHPDATSHPEAGARMREINEAYAVLRDPVRRQEYDTARRPRGQRPQQGVSHRGSPMPAVIMGLVGLLVALRFLGVLVRIPLLLVALGATAYWLVRRVGGVRTPRGRRTHPGQP